MRTKGIFKSSDVAVLRSPADFLPAVVLLLALLIAALGSARRVLGNVSTASLAPVAKALETSWAPDILLAFAPRGYAAVYETLGKFSPQVLDDIYWPQAPGDVYFLALRGDQEETVFKKNGYHYVKSLGAGDYHITHWQRPSPKRTDLWTALPDMTVALWSKKKTTDCTFSQMQGFRCPGKDSWQRVSREILDLDDKAWRCLWMHPPVAGEVLRIGLPKTIDTAHQPLRFFGKLLFTPYAAWRAKAPVDLRLVRGEPGSGEILWAETHGISPYERPFETVLFEDAAKREGRLWLEVQSENNGAAHFCVSAYFEPATALMPVQQKADRP